MNYAVALDNNAGDVPGLYPGCVAGGIPDILDRAHP
jgi:hypothetical protein